MYCKKCGQQLAEDSVFCHSCGEPQKAAVISQATSPTNNSISGQVCPFCGSTHVHTTTETKTTGSNYNAGNGCLGLLLLGPLGLLCGSCGTGQTTTNTTLWVCESCGEKFKRAQDLDKEIEQTRNSSKVLKTLLLVFGIIIFVCSAVLLIGYALGELPEELLALIIFFFAFAILFISLSIFAIPKSFKKSIEKLEAEKAKLYNAAKKGNN